MAQRLLIAIGVCATGDYSHTRMVPIGQKAVAMLWLIGCAVVMLMLNNLES